MADNYISPNNDKTIDYSGSTLLLTNATLTGTPLSNPFTIFYADAAPPSPTAMNDEFTGVLSSAWTSRNSPGSFSWLYGTFGLFDLTYAAGFGTFRGYSQPMPSGDCQFDLKFITERNVTGNVYAGIGFIDNTGMGTFYTYGNDAGLTSSLQQINISGYNYTGKVNPDQNIGEVPYFWLRCKYISSTGKIDVWYSANGWLFKKWRVNSTPATTPTRVIIGGANTFNEQCLMAVDYFRRTL